MRHITLSLAFFIAVGAFAQDQLFKKDNSKTEVKILEVTQGAVKYKLFSYQDGPTITVLKSEVALIIYQDGTHETFQAPAPQQQQPVLVYRDELTRSRLAAKRYRDSTRLVKYDEATSTKNLISLNLLDPANGSIGISYLREFSHGRFHVYAPVSVGVSEPYFNQPENTVFGSPYYNENGVRDFKFNRKTIEAGLGIHIHSSPKKMVTHVIGPYIGISQYTGSYEYSTEGPGKVTVFKSNNFVMNRYTFMLDNGILFRVHKNFNMLMLAGLGYRSDDFVANHPKNYMYSNSTSGDIFDILIRKFPINAVKLNLSLGYRF
jgi:hypothetical protein